MFNFALKDSELLRDDISHFLSLVESRVYGMQKAAILILIAIICNDHILLEDVPGTGKTMLTKTVAQILELDFKRVQGTPDLLPGDIGGVSIFNQKENSFEFKKGPIFTNILLFDEINRASPKTQSALLEAMAERQVTLDGETYPLSSPFFVIATQNPVEHIGTYPLPQAQLDRFLIKTALGYPERVHEKRLIEEEELENTTLRSDQYNFRELVSSWQRDFRSVKIKDSVVEKLLDIVNKSRDNSKFKLGISPRALKKLTNALKASAYIHGREYVTKDDIFDLFLPVIAHRVFTVDADNPTLLLKQLLKEADF